MADYLEKGDTGMSGPIVLQADDKDTTNSEEICVLRTLIMTVNNMSLPFS